MIVFGLDAGIASVGWAVINHATTPVSLRSGVWMFDAPETDKERRPTAAVRRGFRGQRRVVRRRRQRMNTVRRLLADAGLLHGADTDALHGLGADPWEARAAGLDRLLTGAEFAAALGHIAKHRGFRPNSKRDSGANAPDDTSKMKAAIAATRERMQGWRTVGEMFARDPEFVARRRNRSGDYSRSVLRNDQEYEVRRLFEAQRRFGNAAATETLEIAYADAAFSQRPLQDSDRMLGSCPFEPGEKRTARRGYSFELFRLLSRLNALRLSTSAGPRALTPDEVATVTTEFGKTRGLSFAAVRKLLDLSADVRFAQVDRADEAKRDVVARSGAAMEGTYVLRNAVPEGAWRTLLGDVAKLDRIAEVITFRDAPERIRAGLEEIGLDAAVVDALLDALDAGKFAHFSGAGHISAKAARKIVPGLRKGLVYSEACADAGYNHTDSAVRIEEIRNPTVRRAVGEVVKQVRAMAQRFGKPDYIHVELGRDLGRSAEERDRISRDIEKKNKERDKARERLEKEVLGRPASAEELLRYELWTEQNCRCLYTDTYIEPKQLAAGDNSVQVDHILPWSRFGDDSFANKMLCLTSANQAKRGRTPYEWFTHDKPADDWAAFQRRVEDCKGMKGRKKRGFYLRQNADEVAEAFRSRNLNDTRYAARLLLGMLDNAYGVAGQRRVLARPGALTAKLRRAWGWRS